MWSPSVVGSEVDTVHADEGIVIAHDRRKEVVERVANVVLVVKRGDECVWVAGASKVAA